MATCYIVGAGDFTARGFAPGPGDLILAADGGYRAADTQGKRGKKALRMTMAFSEENMDYIRTMGKLESGGATAYVNRLIEADRRKHADVYRQMKSLRPDA